MSHPLRNIWQVTAAVSLAMGFFAPSTFAGFDSGSDGTDGDLDCAWLAKDAAFDCTVECTELSPCEFEVNLADANSAEGVLWNTPGGDVTGDGFGDGVYDVTQWAVVYKFGTVFVPPYITVTFANHPSGAPVVWLAQADVTIAGEVNLDGQDGTVTTFHPTLSEPGPGGFAGATRGIRTIDLGAIGYGPGSPRDLAGGYEGKAATYSGEVGNYSTCGYTGINTQGRPRPYGNQAIMPLIGGSGGGAANNFPYPDSQSAGGGAGGGAIAIASNGTITLAAGSQINANGGSMVGPGNPGSTRQGGAGSGGAIRLMARDLITGAGLLRAMGGCSRWDSQTSDGGGLGRIRLESPFFSVTDGGIPPWTWTDILGNVFPDSSAPRLEVVGIDAVDAVSDPDAGILTPEIELDTDVESTVLIRAENVPEGTVVMVRIVPLRDIEIVVNSMPLVDVGGGLLEATAQVVIPPGYSEIQLRANWTP